LAAGPEWVKSVGLALHCKLSLYPSEPTCSGTAPTVAMGQKPTYGRTPSCVCPTRSIDRAANAQFLIDHSSSALGQKTECRSRPRTASPQRADIPHSRGPHTLAFCRLGATLTFCQCFARRVNVMAAAKVVAARFGNPLSIKGLSTVHGVVFELFVFGHRYRVKNDREAARLPPAPGLRAYTACKHMPVAGGPAVVHAESLSATPPEQRARQ
jgi:hypothetical protein